MTTDREQYLLERCLRLEAEIARLRGMYVAPLLPKVERRSLYVETPPPSAANATLLRRKQRRTSAAERALMVELSERGLSPIQISYRLGMSDTTIRRQLHEAGR